MMECEICYETYGDERVPLVLACKCKKLMCSSCIQNRLDTTARCPWCDIRWSVRSFFAQCQSLTPNNILDSLRSKGDGEAVSTDENTLTRVEMGSGELRAYYEKALQQIIKRAEEASADQIETDKRLAEEILRQLEQEEEEKRHLFLQQDAEIAKDLASQDEDVAPGSLKPGSNKEITTTSAFRGSKSKLSMNHSKNKLKMPNALSKNQPTIEDMLRRLGQGREKLSATEVAKSRPLSLTTMSQSSSSSSSTSSSSIKTLAQHSIPALGKSSGISYSKSGEWCVEHNRRRLSDITNMTFMVSKDQSSGSPEWKRSRNTTTSSSSSQAAARTQSCSSSSNNLVSRLNDADNNMWVSISDGVTTARTASDLYSSGYSYGDAGCDDNNDRFDTSGRNYGSSNSRDSSDPFYRENKSDISLVDAAHEHPPRTADPTETASGRASVPVGVGDFCETSLSQLNTVESLPLPWNCAACTFENKPTYLVCEICGEVRGSPS